MLGPCDNYVGVISPRDQVEPSVALPSGWVLSNGGSLVQGNNHLICYGDPCQLGLGVEVADVSGLCDSANDWDIKDIILPRIEYHDNFEMWPNGDCRFIYQADNAKARKHKCGWAMRNTNNHNKMILKKSCLGVVRCSKDCLYPDPKNRLSLAPKISEGARRGQLNNKCCPNPSCGGSLIQQPCRGKSGNPVTHYWRHHETTNSIYFMAKGTHDHSKPISPTKLSDRKIKLIKRVVGEDNLLQYAADGRPCCKRSNFDVNINAWEDHAAAMTRDYERDLFVGNDYQPFSWASAVDFVNLEMDRPSQQYPPSTPYMKPELYPHQVYNSPNDDKMIVNSKYAPSFLTEFTEPNFSFLEEKFSFPVLPFTKLLKSDPDHKDETAVLDRQWSTYFDHCDVIRQQEGNYSPVQNNEEMKTRIVFNDDFKYFNFYAE